MASSRNNNKGHPCHLRCVRERTRHDDRPVESAFSPTSIGLAPRRFFLADWQDDIYTSNCCPILSSSIFLLRRLNIVRCYSAFFRVENNSYLSWHVLMPALTLNFYKWLFIWKKKHFLFPENEGVVDDFLSRLSPVFGCFSDPINATNTVSLFLFINLLC